MPRIVTNNLHYSSLFSADNAAVNKRFDKACRKLNISKWRRCPDLTIGDSYSLLLTSNKACATGPEDSRIVDVPGDGNCLFYALLAPLLGKVPDQVFALKLLNMTVIFNMFRKLLKV